MKSALVATIIVLVDAPPPPPPPPPPPVVAPAPPQEPPPAPSHRPDGFSIGIGLGYDLPTTLQQPNTTSVRIRLASGLTIEPIFSLGGTTTSNDPGTGTTTSDKTTEFAAAANVRWPRRVHDRVDLVLIGSAGIGVTSTNPDGDNNNTTTSELSLSWGFGLDYWIGPHWAMSLTAENPLIRSQKTSQDNPAGGNGTSTTVTSFGLIFDPNVVLMAHMFL